MDRSQPASASSNLMDLHNRLVADILTRYRTLIMLATVHADADADGRATGPEAMAVAGISLKMEFDGLYSSVKELLTLSRRVKELWAFGPLGQGDPDCEAREAQVDADVARVAHLLNDLDAADMQALAASHAGTWERLTKDAPEAAAIRPPAPTPAPAADGAAAAAAASGG